MKKIWIILGIMILLVQVLPGLAADKQESVAERYKEFYSDDEKTIYLDTETIKYTFDGDKRYIDVWLKFVYTPAGVIAEMKSNAKYNLSIEGYENLSFRMLHYYIYNNQLALLSSIYYSNDGSTIDSFNFEDKYKFSPIVPDSIGENMCKTVTAYAKAHDKILMSRSNQESK